MTYASALLFDRPVFEVARLIGILFDKPPEYVMGRDSPRGSRDRTALTSLLHFFVEEPPGEKRSPIGFAIKQNDAIREFGRTDRGWITQGAKRIEEQLVYDEPAQAITEIGAWITEGLRLAGVIRRYMSEVEVQRDIPNNWRKSLVWETIKALGRSAKRLVSRNEEDIAAEDLLQIEAYEAQQRAEAEARAKDAAKATDRRMATLRKKQAATNAIALPALERARQARIAKLSVTVSKSQSVEEAVIADSELAKIFGELRVKMTGATPTGSCGLVQCAPALRGPGLMLSLFVRTTKKALANPNIQERLKKVSKDRGYRFSHVSAYPYGTGSHDKGGGIWRLDALMLPAGA